jgi:hypothetical protein
VERPLISNATILILSGFLIGLTVGKIVAEDLSPYVLACGLSGFLAFIALDLAAAQRAAAGLQQGQRDVARRLDKICPNKSATSFVLSPATHLSDPIADVLDRIEAEPTTGARC